jgi:hypothetical protein
MSASASRGASGRAPGPQSVRSEWLVRPPTDKVSHSCAHCSRRSLHSVTSRLWYHWLRRCRRPGMRSPSQRRSRSAAPCRGRVRAHPGGDRPGRGDGACKRSLSRVSDPLVRRAGPAGRSRCLGPRSSLSVPLVCVLRRLRIRGGCVTRFRLGTRLCWFRSSLCTCASLRHLRL